MVFVGYEQGSKGYQFWDKDNQSIIISCDMKFDKSKFPNRKDLDYGVVHLCATNFVQMPNSPKYHDVTLTLGLAPKSLGPSWPFGAKKKRKFFCTQQ